MSNAERAIRRLLVAVALLATAAARQGDPLFASPYALTQLRAPQAWT